MNIPRQHLLDLKPEQIPTLDNFVPGGNRELLGRLRALAAPDSFDAIYIWGPPGCGRSHLLRAVTDRALSRRPTTHAIAGGIGESLPLAPGSLLLIDDVDQLSAAGQSALFKTFNAARLAGLALLLSGPVPPRELALREDLRTRIGQTLIYEIKPLSDEEKADALQRHALMRGMRMDEALLQYLLRHGRRDLPALMSVLDALDRVSLEQQRPATLPLLREVMQSTLQLDDENDNS